MLENSMIVRDMRVIVSITWRPAGPRHGSRLDEKGAASSCSLLVAGEQRRRRAHRAPQGRARHELIVERGLHLPA